MKITVIAVGKRHDASISGAVNDYSQRVTRSAVLTWQFIPSPKASLSPAEQKRVESGQIMVALKPTDVVVVLDERGQQWSTTQFAAQLEAWRTQAPVRLVFIIGGAYGVSDELRARAQAVWSLSNLVFPHQLVRLILAEQLYRAFSIIRGEKYHHE